MMGGRIKAFFRHSVTILWARTVALGGLVLAALDQAAELLSLPTIKDNVQALLNPACVPYYLVVIALITELARWRTLGRSDAPATPPPPQDR